MVSAIITDVGYALLEIRGRGTLRACGVREGFPKEPRTQALSGWGIRWMRLRRVFQAGGGTWHIKEQGKPQSVSYSWKQCVCGRTVRENRPGQGPCMSLPGRWSWSLRGRELLNIFEQEYSATFQHHLMTSRYRRLHMPQKLIPDFCRIPISPAFPHLSEWQLYSLSCLVSHPWLLFSHTPRSIHQQILLFLPLSSPRIHPLMYYLHCCPLVWATIISSLNDLSSLLSGLPASSLDSRHCILHTAIRDPSERWDHGICALNLLMTSLLQVLHVWHLAQLSLPPLFFLTLLQHTCLLSVLWTLPTLLLEELCIAVLSVWSILPSGDPQRWLP